MFRNVRICTDNTSSLMKGLDLAAEQMFLGPKTVSRKGASGFIEVYMLETKIMPPSHLEHQQTYNASINTHTKQAIKIQTNTNKLYKSICSC